MRVVIRDSEPEVAEWVAQYVKQRILEFEPSQERPFVMGLPTGSSPLPVYRRLAEMHARGELSFKHVVTFNMDEYVGLPRSHPQSYYSFMYDNFFSKIDIEPRNAHLLNGEAEDLEKECREYEEAIARVGGIELFLGGVGVDSHIAFNEPGSSLSSLTRVKTLAYQTVLDNSRFFGGDVDAVPKMALTVGIATITNAREVLLIVTGTHKALALKQCIEGGVSSMATSSALQNHRRALVVCDDAATDELRVKTVRYFRGIERVAEMKGGSVPRSASSSSVKAGAAAE